MQLTPPALQDIATELLSSPGTFSGTGNVALSKAAFNLQDCTGVVEADFDGYARKAATGWANGQDPVTLNPQLTMTPVAGGYRWVTGANTTANQSIFGWYVVLQPSGIIAGGGVFETPIPIARAAQQINVGVVETELQPGGFL